MSSPEELQALALPGESAAERLVSLKTKLAADKKVGFTPPVTGEVNNHVHTVYSFSPYSPAEAAYGAWRAGLEVVGIVDHESVSGCDEMLKAGKHIGIAVTSGCELRVSTDDTAMGGRRTNNPDSPDRPYIVIHGIPHGRREELDSYLNGIRLSRNHRIAAEVDALNSVLAEAGLPGLDFKTDVLPTSKSSEGGSVTERHILLALAMKMERTWGRGASLLRVLGSSLKLDIDSKLAVCLSDNSNPHFLYDLLGLFKGALTPRFYQQPDARECRPITEVTSFARELGAIPAYPYLGDVGQSPTGDKLSGKYEDDWLEELIESLPGLGFQALTFMPPRNTAAQLTRVMKLCRKAGLMEISGVDINSSRQSFRCPEITWPDFMHLGDSAWALVAHEHLVSLGGPGIFDAASPAAGESLDFRLKLYARMGRGMDARHPETIADIAVKEKLWTT